MITEPLVYVPAHPRVAGDIRDIGVELRATRDGDLVGLAFSSLDGLVASLGDYQPWVAMERDRFTAFVGAAGAPFVCVDPTLEMVQRWSATDVGRLARDDA
ncbi:MAG TPA: SAV_915 family protein [Pseudonocardiaceae bacterium]|nr:SAV_915 family protein [Pseudonocardiaceae bacterium]